MTCTVLGTARRRSSSRIADGTVLIRRTSSAAGKEDKLRALSAKITRPPQHSGTNSSKTERSKQMLVENKTPDSSWAEKVSLAQQTISTALRCSKATPFGRPVEPEV